MSAAASAESDASEMAEKDPELGLERGGENGEEEDVQEDQRLLNAMNAVARPGHFAAHHPRCAPCNCMRCASSLMIPLILGMVAVSWVPYTYVFWDGTILGTVAVVVFHVLVALMLASYFQTWYLDAGSVPEDWHRAVERVAKSNKPTYRKCSRTGKFKPPRSHYDPITRRIVLNMDHFCPWVANTVGYHNRKFFILFTFYGCLACAWVALTLFPFAFGYTQQKADDEGVGSRRESMRGLAVLATALDGTFAVCLFFFSLGHLYMACNNTTSLEGSSEAYHFDLGRRRNFEQVFGRNPRFWFLPIYGEGPVGDGVVWTLRDGSVFGHPHQVFEVRKEADEVGSDAAAKEEAGTPSVGSETTANRVAKE